ncbi:MAG: PsbP-related protein [Pseudomonadota bacterium]
MYKAFFKFKGLLLFIMIIVVSVSFFYVGRLPAAVYAFKEDMQADRAERQLFEAYNVMDDTFHFQLPYSWNTHEVSFLGGEILYHMDFLSPDRRIHGFIQVWKLSKTVKEFIDESEKAATGIVDFKDFSVKEIMVDNRKGYLMEYSRLNQEGEYNKAYEVFIGGPEKRMYRISFFVPEKEWRNYFNVLFERIIHSVKIKS